MKKYKITIGSRKSKLALIYAQNVKKKILEISSLQENQIEIKGNPLDALRKSIIKAKEIHRESIENPLETKGNP